MRGILPGVTHGDRLRLLMDPVRLATEVAATRGDPQGTFDVFLRSAAAVERGSRGRRLRPGVVRDEAEQAGELDALLDLAEQSGVDGAFIYTYVAPSYPSSPIPGEDLDAASYALVRSWSDRRTEPKLAFRAVAQRYRQDAPAIHSRPRCGFPLCCWWSRC